MKSLKEFKCVWIIPNVDIKKGKNSQYFGEITIKASPPIYIYLIPLYEPLGNPCQPQTFRYPLTTLNLKLLFVYLGDLGTLKEGFKKNHWICDHDHTLPVPPLFFENCDCLFFALFKKNILVIRYVWKLILVIFQTNFDYVSVEILPKKCDGQA